MVPQSANNQHSQWCYCTAVLLPVTLLQVYCSPLVLPLVQDYTTVVLAVSFPFPFLPRSVARYKPALPGSSALFTPRWHCRAVGTADSPSGCPGSLPHPHKNSCLFSVQFHPYCLFYPSLSSPFCQPCHCFSSPRFHPGEQPAAGHVLVAHAPSHPCSSPVIVGRFQPHRASMVL